jgi:hypothetical protein
MLALAAGAAAGWFARTSEIKRLEQEITDLEDQMADADSDEPTEAADGTDPARAEEPPAATEEPPATTEEPVTGERETPTGPTERQPGLIVGTTTVDGAWVIKIDYVQFLTGGEAADAAAAHGDESPPPNDYYVVNDNPKIRQFKVKPGIPVFVVTNNDGTSDADGHTITLDQWIAALSGPQAAAFKASLYWVTVTDGTVTAIEAQYVP